MPDAPIEAFVCGHPIAHSRSPLIHGYWLEELSIDGKYGKVDVAPSELAAFLAGLRGSYVGGNVTIPHKEMAFQLVGRRDAAAEQIGAVNTLWFDEGMLVGGNTDAYGFAANLDQQAPGWDSGERALVIGAGGAAKAVVHALCERGIKDVRIVNRNWDRAGALAARYGKSVSAHPWQAVRHQMEGASLLVNTTSLGMKGSENLTLDLDPLPDNAVVADLVYLPLETDLLRAARARGLRAVDGLGMLLHQAVPGFERWFGKRPTVSPGLRAHLVADLESAK